MTSKNVTAIKLTDRGTLYISGEDSRKFLQNLITNNVNKIKPGEGLYASLLTPQGKYLFDFFLLEDEGNLILDCHESQTESLLQKLTMYKLRANVEIENVSSMISVWSTTNLVGPDKKHHRSIPDPRHKDIGWRLYLPADGKPNLPQKEMADYKARRLEIGIPEGPDDLEPNKRFIMEANFEELNGLDFTKGCYVGQEINARMKHRGTLKKRILPIGFEGEAPPLNTPIKAGKKGAGETLSSINGKALALMRLDRLKDELTLEDGRKVHPEIPDWISIS